MAVSSEPDMILATDVGSTTSKARLFKKIGGEYRFVVAGEAPTTVESPFNDVRVGVRNAIKQIEDLTGTKFLTDDGSLKKDTFYVSTSSAGGGLQIMVSGVIRRMTAESGERAALGAGAIVLDVLAIDDGREIHEKIKRMRSLRPDMILMVGGTDMGDEMDLIETAELFISAKPSPRFGLDFKLPVIFAGNRAVQNRIREILCSEFALKIVPNIRPTLDVEYIDPARDGIHEFYLEHVMSHAPGYPDLMKWTSAPILPTPAGEGMMFRVFAESHNVNMLGVGLGGATTNIYSIYDGKFVRSVSANLGMSYSICNVLKETGLENIMRWIPLDLEEDNVRNVLRNKMIRPTTIPDSLVELMIEHAVAREAIRLGFEAHKSLATPLRGARREKDISAIGRGFEYKIMTYIDMMRINYLGGTGGLLSHAPRRVQSALMLIDSFRVEGVTRLFQDSVFMIPHLGVLSTVNPKAAINILEKDCLVKIGTCIAPSGLAEDGVDALTISEKMPDGTTLVKVIPYGRMELIPLGEGQKAEVEIKPHSNLDVGMGRGKSMKTEVEGGVVGIIIDTRGRPLVLPKDERVRKKKLIEWYTAVGAYPEGFLKGE